MFKRARTVHALDHAATVIGNTKIHRKEIMCEGYVLDIAGSAVLVNTVINSLVQ
jgi:hypothetical protein